MNFNAVGPDYFRTMATPMLAGRDFDDRHDQHAPKVAIVSETVREEVLRGRNPIGQDVSDRRGVGVERPLYEIVGLVKDAKYTDLREEFTPIATFRAAQGTRDVSRSCRSCVRSSAPLTTFTVARSAARSRRSSRRSLQFQTMRNSMVTRFAAARAADGHAVGILRPARRRCWRRSGCTA